MTRPPGHDAEGRTVAIAAAAARFCDFDHIDVSFCSWKMETFSFADLKNLMLSHGGRLNVYVYVYVYGGREIHRYCGVGTLPFRDSNTACSQSTDF
mmetsp:Transcript_13875/g.32257  ORF Transcript_13875/g.32257 Transcript_13875/m.32257 type:complete len:96 (-) Transcript_13875:272-559(-)